MTEGVASAQKGPSCLLVEAAAITYQHKILAWSHVLTLTSTCYQAHVPIGSDKASVQNACLRSCLMQLEFMPALCSCLPAVHACCCS